MKIVINSCYGGFWLSDKAVQRAKENGADFDSMDVPRDDPILVSVVEELGSKANGLHSDLRIVEIPDGVNWRIEDYDGKEWVAEVHRTWG